MTLIFLKGSVITPIGGGGGVGGGLPKAQVDARVAALSLKGNSYYDYADRAIVATADRDDATKITIEHDAGTVYYLDIEQNSDLIHLVDVDTGTAIRLSEGNTLWLGRIESYTKTGAGVWTFKINFFMRRSTFTTDENIHVEFGAIPHSRTSFFYGFNQTERIPDDLSALHNVTNNWRETFNGQC